METTTSIRYSQPLSKKDIIQRLFMEEKITFDEMWILLQDNDGAKFIPFPYYPWPIITEPYYTTSTSDKA